MKKLICFLIFISANQVVLPQKNDSENIQEILDRGRYHLDMVDLELLEPSKDLQEFKSFFYTDIDSQIKPIGNSDNFTTLKKRFQDESGDFVLKIIKKKSYLAIVENSVLSLSPINDKKLLSFAVDLETNILEIGDSEIPLQKKEINVNDRNNIFKSELEGVVWEIDSQFKTDSYKNIPINDFNMKVCKIKGSNKIYIEIMAVNSFEGNTNKKILYKLLSTDSYLE